MVARSGVALLLALATLVVVLSLLATGLRVGWLHAQTALQARERLQVEVLRADAEAIARGWIGEHGRHLQTPGDRWWAPTPIVDSAYRVAGAERELRVVVAAWDVRAGIPLHEQVDGLRRLLPDGLQEVDPDFDAPLPRSALDRVDLPAGWRRYPAVAGWSGSPPALGSDADAQVAALWLGLFGDVAVNARTAPPAVLAAILEARGRGQLLRDWLRARAEGRPPMIPPDLSRPHDGYPAIIDHTDRWRVGVSVGLGSRRNSWWNLFMTTRDGARVVQRQVVTEP